MSAAARVRALRIAGTALLCARPYSCATYFIIFYLDYSSPAILIWRMLRHGMVHVNGNDRQTVLVTEIRFPLSPLFRCSVVPLFRCSAVSGVSAVPVGQIA
jgi:hypothetical protein